MRTAVHDVAVIGLGAMGSAIVCHLAGRGADVIGFDRLRPPHAEGSSHGESRIIREAYFEHPAYVPLVQRAYALWSELETVTGAVLHLRTGGLMIGLPGSDLVTGALRSAAMHDLPHEVLDAAEVRARFPALAVPDDMVAVLEPRAGILYPERCITAHLDVASRRGAELHFDRAVLDWRVEHGIVHVRTADGEARSKALVVSAGAWVTSMLGGATVPFTVERQVVHWFDAHGDPRLSPERCPVHLWQFDGSQFFYGFPELGAGVKLARHHGGRTVTPATVDRVAAPEEVEDIRQLAQRFVPAAAGQVRASIVCLYTNTPDEHFWIDRHPAHAQVLIVSACSGHGFKFSSAIGELLADRITGAPDRCDTRLFRARDLAHQPT